METSCAVWRSTSQNPPFDGKLWLSNGHKERRFRRVWPSRGHGRAGLERKGLGFGRGLHRQATFPRIWSGAGGQAEILGGDRRADIESARAPRSATVAGRTRGSSPIRESDDLSWRLSSHLCEPRRVSQRSRGLRPEYELRDRLHFKRRTSPEQHGSRAVRRRAD